MKQEGGQNNERNNSMYNDNHHSEHGEGVIFHERFLNGQIILFLLPFPMNVFSKRSEANLSTCHPDIIRIANLVLPIYDHSVICGNRSKAEQFNRYKQGREFVKTLIVVNGLEVTSGRWDVVDEAKVVTNCDGTKIEGKHTRTPSDAIDVAPYPIDWNDYVRFAYLAGLYIARAESLGITLRWGGHFESPKDYPHLERI